MEYEKEAANNAVNTADPTSGFVSLFALHNWGIYKYIRTLVPDSDSAQEIFQETSVLLWQKYDEFEPGSNFFAWACRIAYFAVLSNRRDRGRDRLQFDDLLLETIAEERVEMESSLQAQQRALPDCMRRLPPKDYELIERHYGGATSVREIARQSGRSVNTLYKALERIRRTLMLCIEKKMSRE
jgi:RNA polymerase sigma-70 factor (ECF subfamily)